ncbi:MAG: hypothetical protein RL030_1842, partial [Pseudomonadota bacterium]
MTEINGDEARALVGRFGECFGD